MIASVRPYFKRIMKELGFQEWRKSLEPDNIPKTLIDKIYHLKTESVSSRQNNQGGLELSVPVVVSYAHKALPDEVSAYEQSESTLDGILTEALKATNRLSIPGVKNVTFEGMDSEALSPTNDNVLISRARFTAFVILNV